MKNLHYKTKIATLKKNAIALNVKFASKVLIEIVKSLEEPPNSIEITVW